MMDNCPVCGNGKVIVESYFSQFVYKETLIQYLKTDRYCTACGTNIVSPELVRENIKSKRLALKEACCL